MFTLIRMVGVCAILFCTVDSLHAQRQFEIHGTYVKMPPLVDAASLGFSEILTLAEFREVLAGELRLGRFQPVVILRCVSAIPVDTARLRYRIMNDATGKIVYNTTKYITRGDLLDTVLSGTVYCDSLGNGIPLPPRTFAVAEGEFVRVHFPSYEPSDFFDDQRGQLIIATMLQCYPTGVGVDTCNQVDQDTVSHVFHRLMRLQNLNFLGGRRNYEYHHIQRTGFAVPDIFQFSSFGTTISPNVPNALAAYRTDVITKPANSTTFTMANPVLLFDRLDERGKKYVGEVTGDTLTTFPININAAKTATIVLCARRGYPSGAAHRRWLEDTLYGPEPKSKWSTVEFHGDSLILEILRPSTDGLNSIINPTQDQFIDQLAFRQALFMDRAWLPNRSEVYTVAIPDSILNSVNEGARNFRFRLTLRAREHGAYDDTDPWLVDEIHVYKDGDQDVSLQDVSIPLSYSVIPHRQAAVAPLHFYVTNRTRNTHHNVRVRVQAQSLSIPSRSVSVERTIDSITSLQRYSVAMPTINLNDVVNPTYFNTSVEDTVLLTATIVRQRNANGVDVVYADDFPFNDTIMRRVPVRIGRALAYDAYEYEGHHVVAMEAGKGTNFGLRTSGYAWDSEDTLARYGGSPTTRNPNPGAILMQFQCAWRDTIFGYQFAFDRNAIGDSACNVELYSVETDGTYTPIAGTRITIRVGDADVPKLDSIGTYSLAQPVALEAGTYMLRLHQQTQEPLNLCATAARAGVHVGLAHTNGSLGSIHIADPSWYTTQSTQPFPFYSEVDGGEVVQLVGDRGFLCYIFGDFYGKWNGERRFRRGTWVPVMRAVLGNVPTDLSTSVYEAANAAPSIVIAPNPAHGSIRITAQTDSALSVELIALTGDVLCKGQEQGAITLDVSALVAGVYIVRTTAGAHITSNIVVVYK